MKNPSLSVERVRLEEEFRDPILAKQMREMAARALGDAHHLVGHVSEDLYRTQAATYKAVARGETAELFAPMVPFLLHAFSDEAYVEKWIDLFQVGIVESLGLVPSIFKVEPGFIILIPTGFFEVLECVQAEVEQLVGKTMYDVSDESKWPRADVERAVGRVSQSIENVLGVNRGIESADVLWPDLDRRNRVLQFVIAHEMIHALRDHFDNSGLPMGSRNLERAADSFGLSMCLRAEDYAAFVLLNSDDGVLENARWVSEREKNLLRSCRQRGIEEGRSLWMRHICGEYVIACKVFFATVHILENTVGHTSLARTRLRTHPAPSRRSMRLQWRFGGLSRYFGRRIPLIQRYAFGMAYWRFAKMFLSRRGATLRRIVDENDNTSWAGRGTAAASAMRVFS